MNTINNKKKHSSKNWELISTDNDPIVFRELLNTYREGNIEELGEALEKCYDASKRWAKHELWELLKNLMENVLLVKFSDEYKTQEHWEKICRLRSAIEGQLEDYDFFLDKNSIQYEWNSAFSGAKELAITYVPEASTLMELSNDDVFETIY